MNAAPRAISAALRRVIEQPARFRGAVPRALDVAGAFEDAIARAVHDRAALPAHHAPALLETVHTLEEHRGYEQAFARRLTSLVNRGAPRWVEVEADAHLHCRTRGQYGLDQVGTAAERPGARWLHKCGRPRCCADEAHREQIRRIRQVAGALELWAASPRRRLFYAVLTCPNAPRGQLADCHAATFDAFRAFRAELRAELGSTITLEDPLAAGGDWNVHVNAVMAIAGPLDYGRIHTLWSACLRRQAYELRDGVKCIRDDRRYLLTHGAVLQIQPIKGRRAAIRRALVEVLKYAAAAVSAKSEAKRAAGASDAPGFVEWPDAALLEWLAAHRHRGDRGTALRRTRSYGVLMRPERLAWRLANLRKRLEWCTAAGLPRIAADASWRHLQGYRLLDSRRAPTAPGEPLACAIRAELDELAGYVDELYDPSRWQCLGAIVYRRRRYLVTMPGGPAVSSTPGNNSPQYVPVFSHSRGPP